MELAHIITNCAEDWKTLLMWANQFNYCIYYTGTKVKDYPYNSFPNTIAIGDECLTLDENNIFNDLDQRINMNTEDKYFGYLSYDLLEETHGIKTKNSETIQWQKACFFKPHTIITFSENKIFITSDKMEAVKNDILKYLKLHPPIPTQLGKISKISCNISRQTYIDTVNELKQQIEEGNVYEINYCINNYAKTKDFNPLVAFNRLSEKSPTPFGVYFKCKDKYIICASPERFIKIKDNKIISQPIKGTAKRSKSPIEDQRSRDTLFNSEKERAENMMIVDLVRNDLAQSAVTGTVKVEELFGIYPFKYVHQMISTVTAVKEKSISNVTALKNAFPMGSMTGAPKKSAIKLIEHYETHKRGVFSGAIGHFNGNTSLDFNVVIRSIFYDNKSKLLNYQIGSAITYDANAEDEYKECLLKAQAIEEILKS